MKHVNMTLSASKWAGRRLTVGFGFFLNQFRGRSARGQHRELFDLIFRNSIVTSSLQVNVIRAFQSTETKRWPRYLMKYD